MKKFLKHFRTAFIFSVSMLVICGFMYPMLLTGVSQGVFPKQANGSMVEVDGKVIGSSLVGQDFSDDRLFRCRPSAYNYNTYSEEEKESGKYTGVSSGSTNYASSNPALKKRVEKDIQIFLKENPTIERKDIPADIITASGSGLDPHISIEAANAQLDRVAKNSEISKKKLKLMIKQNTNGKVLGIFGENTVNVLTLNVMVAKEIGMI